VRLAPPSHKQKGDFPLPLGNWGRLHAQHWRPLLTCFLKVSQCSTMIFLTEQFDILPGVQAGVAFAKIDDTKQKRIVTYGEKRCL